VDARRKIQGRFRNDPDVMFLSPQTDCRKVKVLPSKCNLMVNLIWPWIQTDRTALWPKYTVIVPDRSIVNLEIGAAENS